MSGFIVEARSGAARAGTLSTPRGEIPTPAFMPVATQGAVKGATHEELEGLGFRLLIANTYHLAVRPGVEAIRSRGGLHRFMGWSGPLATDSGGFQAMSLSRFRSMTDEGVTFRSPVDGREHVFTPESVMGHQEALGSDLAMCLDECAPVGASEDEVARAAARTTAWARRTLSARREGCAMLFGIVQGGFSGELRARSASEITAMGFDGYAIGGLSVGEEKGLTMRTLAATTPALPGSRVRYLMGVGEPGDVLEAVRLGVDLFDCVFPTRVARNGLALTRRGRLVVRNAPSAGRDEPVDADCPCPACRRYSQAYLRHLLTAGEIAGLRLLTVHNLQFMADLVRDARRAIVEDRYEAFARERTQAWRPTGPRE